MTNLCIAFEKLDGVATDKVRKGKIDPGCEHVNMHMIFGINMNGNFTRKSRLVTDGHTTAPPSSITYSSVVSREINRILFLLASLDDLDNFAYDIGNAYLDAKFRENFVQKQAQSLRNKREW